MDPDKIGQLITRYRLKVLHEEDILVGEARLGRFQKEIRGRLKGWKEEEHRADKMLRELVPKAKDS